MGNGSPKGFKLAHTKLAQRLPILTVPDDPQEARLTGRGNGRGAGIALKTHYFFGDVNKC